MCPGQPVLADHPQHITSPWSPVSILIAETKASHSIRLDALRAGLQDAGCKQWKKPGALIGHGCDAVDLYRRSVPLVGKILCKVPARASAANTVSMPAVHCPLSLPPEPPCPHAFT